MTEQIIRSHGFAWEGVFAIPFGALMSFMGVWAIIEGESVFTIAVALFSLAFGVVVLVSCAYSLWGTCTVVLDGDHWVITNALWGWRRSKSVSTVEIATVAIRGSYGRGNITPATTGLYIHVQLRIGEWFRIGLGLHAPREELERLCAMIEATIDKNWQAPFGWSLLEKR